MPPKPRSAERGEPSSAYDTRVQTRRQVEASAVAAGVNLQAEDEQRHQAAQASLSSHPTQLVEETHAQAQAQAPALNPDDQIAVWQLLVHRHTGTPLQDQPPFAGRHTPLDPNVQYALWEVLHKQLVQQQQLQPEEQEVLATLQQEQQAAQQQLDLQREEEELLDYEAEDDLMQEAGQAPAEAQVHRLPLHMLHGLPHPRHPHRLLHPRLLHSTTLWRWPSSTSSNRWVSANSRTHAT